MPEHVVRDPDFERRVREGFAAQAAMRTIGAVLTRVAPGEVDVELPYRDDLTQQNGFLHAGIVTAVVDTACGFAALTLMAPGHDVLSVEFKVNLLAPAAGERFIARGRVLKPGRTLTVCTGDLHAVSADGEKLVATMTATMIGR
jgi:uncharacterized protein (TIGR00369 family)